MDIEFNNVADVDTGGTGWFVGFNDWARGERSGAPQLRYMPQEVRSHKLCVKWMSHCPRDPRGSAKPASEGRTLSLLVSESGSFHLEFSRSPAFQSADTVRFSLQRHGDFVIWGENLHHRWFVERACTIITVRWIPEHEPLSQPRRQPSLIPT